MANIPGTNNPLPGTYSTVTTVSKGASVPNNGRVAAIIGEGQRSEVLVSSALGSGLDGFSPDYVSKTTPDGRHFLLSFAPAVKARTTLFRNGLPLVGLEEQIDSNSFSSKYDYRLDPSLGQIEMQTAHLVDQGGAFFTASSLNVGQGSIQNLSLIDLNAPSETWTIKCISVQRNSFNQPIGNTAKFTAFGTVSGTIVDGYGNPVVWVADDVIVDNTILKFSIHENTAGSSVISPYREGDSFTIKVNSGVLNKNDSLTASYIAIADLNDPTFFTSIQDIQAKHGPASLSNNLTLGCQLAFANQTSGVMCLQAAPPIPRRSTYDLATNFDAASSNYKDFVLPLPAGVVPDLDSQIHFFVTNPATNLETQLLPNKFTFYTLGTSGQPTVSTFVMDATEPPAGNAFSYSVIEDVETLNFGIDGYINANITSGDAYFSTSTFSFDSSYVGLNLNVIDATNSANIGLFSITAVKSGVAVIHTTGSPFVTEHALKFEVQDPGSTSNYVVLNKEIVPNGYSLRVTLVTTDDADFFDAGWENALAALETQEIDILVPLPKQTISVIFQNALNHCLSMSNTENRKERVLFIGAINGLTPDNVLGNKDAAVEDIGILEGLQGDSTAEILAGNTEDLTNYSVVNSYGETFRAVYFYPDQIVVQVGTDNTILDGFYMAAAAAGYLSGQLNVSIPLTNKVLSGFTIPKSRQFKPIILKELVAAGICVLQPVLGGGNVVHGVTTTQSGFIEESEISIVFIRDRIAKNFRAGFNAFIGTAADDATSLALSARAVALLSAFLSQKLITTYKSLIVKQDDVDPSQWNVSVAVAPIYPVNFVYISVSIGLL